MSHVVRVVRSARFLTLQNKYTAGTLLSVGMSTSSSDDDRFEVRHDAELHCFYLTSLTTKKNVGLLEYDLTGNTMDMFHTEVDQKLQGKGLAKHLAKAAFDHAVTTNKRMVLTCTYLQKYYRENPDDKYKNLIDS